MIDQYNLERLTLATILESPQGFIAIQGELAADLFRESFHKKTMEAIHSCVEQGVKITPVNIALIGKFDPVEQTQLAEVGMSNGDLGLLAKALTERAVESKIADFKLSDTAELDAFELLDRLYITGEEATALFNRHAAKDKTDMLNDYLEYLQTNAKEGVRRISTPFPTLNKMLSGGLEDGGYSLIGGAPGSGKSSLMLTIALHAAKNGIRTTFIEGEMTSHEIFERLNGIDTGVDIARIRKGLHYDSSSREFIAKIHDLPIQVVIAADRSLHAVEGMIQKAVQDRSRLIFVDYLQVFAAKGEDEFKAIKLVSERLRGLALRYNVHIFAASSLNRNEANTGKVTLASLYGSSGLGHDATLAMVITGEQDDTNELINPRRAVCLSVLKSRGGARGKLNLIFHLDSQRIEEHLINPVIRNNDFRAIEGVLNNNLNRVLVFRKEDYPEEFMCLN